MGDLDETNRLVYLFARKHFLHDDIYGQRCRNSCHIDLFNFVKPSACWSQVCSNTFISVHVLGHTRILLDGEHGGNN